MLDAVNEFYKELLNIYKTQNDKLTKGKKKKKKAQNIPENLPIDLYLGEDDLAPMPAQEGDE